MRHLPVYHVTVTVVVVVAASSGTPLCSAVYHVDVQTLLVIVTEHTT